MKKVLFCVLIITAALIVISCGKDEKELSTINPGLYEINFDVKYGGQLLILKQRVRYKADNTFEATNFENNVPVEELKGKYRVENNQLISYDNEMRMIKTNGNWEKRDISKVEIRKLRKDSYEYFFKFPNEQLRERFKSLGLSEGWKDYKRISD